jgi:prevent-host-death family protein
MIQVNIHTAKTQLSKLIEAALAGEEVVIAKGSQPVVRLVPIPQGRFKLGVMAGALGPIPDFLEPQEAADLDAWEGAPA